LELASRIFVGIAFGGCGIGGAVAGRSGWFLMLEENAEWLGALLWPVFLFGNFPSDGDSVLQEFSICKLACFPLSYDLTF